MAVLVVSDDFVCSITEMRYCKASLRFRALVSRNAVVCGDGDALPVRARVNFLQRKQHCATKHHCNGRARIIYAFQPGTRNDRGMSQITIGDATAHRTLPHDQ